MAVRQFAEHFGKPPDQLGPNELRTYQAYLLKERKLAVGTVVARVAALRFFLVRTLKRHEFREDLPYPKDHRRLPTVLSLEEVSRLISAAGNLVQCALLMVLYGTGMRRTEVSLLKVSDIDSQRMIIRVERGKGGAGSDLPLSPALLETLREYWRWKKPKQRGQVTGVGSIGQPETGGTDRSGRKAAAFRRWHESDESRGSSPESVSVSG